MNAANEFYERHRAFYENWLKRPEAAAMDQEFMNLCRNVVKLREAGILSPVRKSDG